MVSISNPQISECNDGLGNKEKCNLEASKTEDGFMSTIPEHITDSSKKLITDYSTKTLVINLSSSVDSIMQTAYPYELIPTHSYENSNYSPHSTTYNQSKKPKKHHKSKKYRSSKKNKFSTITESSTDFNGKNEFYSTFFSSLHGKDFFNSNDELSKFSILNFDSDKDENLHIFNEDFTDLASDPLAKTAFNYISDIGDQNFVDDFSTTFDGDTATEDYLDSIYASENKSSMTSDYLFSGYLPYKTTNYKAFHPKNSRNYEQLFTKSRKISNYHGTKYSKDAVIYDPTSSQSLDVEPRNGNDTYEESGEYGYNHDDISIEYSNYFEYEDPLELENSPEDFEKDSYYILSTDSRNDASHNGQDEYKPNVLFANHADSYPRITLNQHNIIQQTDYIEYNEINYGEAENPYYSNIQGSSYKDKKGDEYQQSGINYYEGDQSEITYNKDQVDTG
ncbi:hypothetical protein AYI68_g4420, partial [Smittium mucronatum]